MQKLPKELILGFAVVLLGVFSWYFLKYVFYIGNLITSCWIGGGILFILFGIALCLAMLLIRDKKILYGSFILTLISFGMFFNNEPFYYLVGLILLFIGFFLGVKRIRREEEVQVNLNFWHIWKRGLPIFMTALILVISLIYYFSPGILQNQQTEIRIPQDKFNMVIKPIEKLIKERLPEGTDLNSPINSLLTSEQVKELEKNYGIKINEGDTGKDILYKLVGYQLNNATGPYRRFIPFGLAIALFVGLKILSFIYIPFVILFSWLVLKLLLALKFARIEVETKEVETVKL